MLTIDTLAQEIRRVDGNHSLGAGALAEALTPFISAALSIEQTQLAMPMHRTRHKISDLAGWSEWSRWEEGIGGTDDPTFEIEIENRHFYPAPTPVSSLVNAQADADVVERLRQALEAAVEWIGIVRGSCGSVEMPSWDNRDPSQIERDTFALIDASLSSLRPAEVGSATDTSGIGGDK